jgi:WD40 repeat protein
MVGSRNLEDKNPRKALLFFDMALKQKKESIGASQPTGTESTENDQLAHWFSEALIQTQGQIAFMGGADGHQGAINSSSFSPDGSVILTRGEDRQVKLWEARTGHLLRTLGPSASELLQAKISPHGKFVVTTTKGGLATIYELSSGKVVAVMSPAEGGQMYDASFNADESLLATATTDGIARVWEVKYHDKPITEPLYSLKSPEADTAVIFRVAFVPRSNGLVAIEDTPTNEQIRVKKGLARLWNYEAEKPLQTFLFDSGFITQLVGNGQGTYLLAGPDEAVIWAPSMTSAGKHFWLQDAKGNPQKGIAAAVFSHNGKLLVTSSEKDASLWDTESGSMAHLLHGHSESIEDVGFNADDSLIATASDDGTVKIWDAAGGHLQASLSAHGKMNAGVFSPVQPNVLVTASDDHTAILWDWKKVFQPEATITQSQSVHEVAFSADDKFAVTASEDGTAIIYDLATHKEVQRLAEAKGLRVAEFSTDGRRVVTAGKGDVAEIWDVRTGKRLSNPMRHSDQVIVAHFSPDGKWLVTVGEDHVAKIWKVDETAHVTPWGEYTAQHDQAHDEQKHIHDAQFSPDSKWIVFASDDNTAAIWDVAGKKIRFLLPHKNWVYTARFSGNGKRIVTASTDGTAGVWDTLTGKNLYTLPGWSPLQYASFSPDPDGRRIVTAGENGSASIWDAVNYKPNPLISLKSNQGTIYIAGFNSNGTLLTTASDDGKIEVWETSTGYEVFSTEENPSTNHVIFAHKDPLLLGVASTSGRSSFWRVPANHLPLSELDAAAQRLAPDDRTKELWMAELPNASAKSVTSSNQETPLGQHERSSILH